MQVGHRSIDRPVLERIARAYYPGRTGQIVGVPKEGHIITRRDPTVKYMHGSPWDYDTRIPFFFYGPAFIRQGTFPGPVTQQDMAPTLASLLGVPMPRYERRPLVTAILDSATGPPRLIVLVVLDGMRLDYFDRYAAVLPTLDRLRRQGAWFTNARINYLPSITSVAHATIATGADPNVDGIVGNSLFDRVARGGDRFVPGPFSSTLDGAHAVGRLNFHTDGRAVIIGQGSIGRAALPLAGHGACQLNGHAVIAVSYNLERGAWETNPECYRLPTILAERKRTRAMGGERRPAGWDTRLRVPTRCVARRSSRSSRPTRCSLMIEREPLGPTTSPIFCS